MDNPEGDTQFSNNGVTYYDITNMNSTSTVHSAINMGARFNQYLNSTDGLFPPDFDPDDMSHVPYPGEVSAPPVWEMAVKISFCALITLLALIGNLVVVNIVWKNKKMHTTTNYYIVNLAVSDLMVTISCTWVHLVDNLTEGWVLGAFFCKFNSFAQGKYMKPSC